MTESKNDTNLVWELPDGTVCKHIDTLEHMKILKVAAPDSSLMDYISSWGIITLIVWLACIAFLPWQFMLAIAIMTAGIVYMKYYAKTTYFDKRHFPEKFSEDRARGIGAVVLIIYGIKLAIAFIVANQVGGIDGIASAGGLLLAGHVSQRLLIFDAVARQNTEEYIWETFGANIWESPKMFITRMTEAKAKSRLEKAADFWEHKAKAGEFSANI